MKRLAKSGFLPCSASCISSGVHSTSGTVTALNATVGSAVTHSVVATIQDTDALKIAITVEEYDIAAERLRDLGPDSRHYDLRSIVRMCISVSENLIDSEHPEDSEPFIRKGLDILGGFDPWSDNRRMELRSLAAEALDGLGNVEASVEQYSIAIAIGTDLMSRGVLEEPDALIMDLVMKAGSETDMGRHEDSVADLTAAVGIMESMMENHMAYDREALVTLHHDLASALMKVGRTEEAEKHLIRAMEIGVAGYVSSDDLDINVRRSR